jgi:hypothetical protein
MNSGASGLASTLVPRHRVVVDDSTLPGLSNLFVEDRSEILGDSVDDLPLSSGW